MAVLEGRHEIHLLHLPRHRLGDLAPAMPGIAAEEARGGVEHLAAVMVDEIDALGAHEEPGIGLEVLVGRERNPLVLEGVPDDLHGGVPLLPWPGATRF